VKSAIYTRRGDDGTTGLADGSRVKKDSVRLEAYGTIDEAGAHLGLALAEISDVQLSEILTFLAHRLFNCSSQLSFSDSGAKKAPGILKDDVAFLESAIDFLDEKTAPLTGFVLCGGSKTGRASASLHIARTVLRRAERLICSLTGKTFVDPLLLQFINRASDLLFASARYQNELNMRSEVLWDKNVTPPEL
jgi:cob(I)alamin adenosyltransferase